MIDLPQWLENRIEEMECPKCSKNIELKSIIGIGIKEYDEEVDNKRKGKKKGKERVSYLVIEHKCAYCNSVYGFDLTLCDVKEFVFDMLDKYGLINGEDVEHVEDEDVEHVEELDVSRKISKNKNKNKNKKIGISQKEIDNFTNMMKDCKSWTDIMDRVGISREDRERYVKDSAKDK